MPDMSGVDVFRAAKRIDPDILGIMVTAFASADTAIEAMRLGAHDYLSKPFDVDELKIKVRNALEQRQLRQENVLLKRVLGTTHQFANIVGRSEKMLAVFKLIEQIARTDSTVLVTGESGTGKEWVARAIHFYSLRRDRPFVALNCGALPETLLESELFGHMKGSFTGASINKKGLIEAAERGTLFLDEIGEMTPLMQVKLLRVLQERKFRQARRRRRARDRDARDRRYEPGSDQDGGGRKIPGGPVLPHQRDPDSSSSVARAWRGHPAAGGYFLAKYRDQMGKDVHGLAQESMNLLEVYEWPGNIRELENVVERAVALEKSQAILPESLPEHIVKRVTKGPAAAGSAARVRFQSRRACRRASRRNTSPRRFSAPAGSQVKAAELLGMTFRSFRYYAKKYQSHLVNRTLD